MEGPGKKNHPIPEDDRFEIIGNVTSSPETSPVQRNKPWGVFNISAISLAGLTGFMMGGYVGAIGGAVAGSLACRLVRGKEKDMPENITYESEIVSLDDDKTPCLPEKPLPQEALERIINDRKVDITALLKSYDLSDEQLKQLAALLALNDNLEDNLEKLSVYIESLGNNKTLKKVKFLLARLKMILLTERKLTNKLENKLIGMIDKITEKMIQLKSAPLQ